MTAGLLGALGAALCYGAASVLQAIGAQRAGRGQSRAGIAGLVVGVARQWQYVAGLAFDGLGFASSVLALRTLPLFVVQAAIASSIAVTALLAHWFLGVTLRRREKFAMVVLGVGLVLLASSAHSEPAGATSPAFRAALVSSLAVVAVVAIASARAPAVYRSAALAAAAGLAFTGVGVAARVLVVPHPLWRILLAPVALSLAVYAAFGLVLFAAALQQGSVTIATAMLFAVETVVPAVIGLTFLGDRPRSGYAAVAVAGFMLTVGGAVALARHGEVRVEQ